MKISKVKAFGFWIFCFLTALSLMFGSIAACAADSSGYNGCPKNVLEMISKATWWKNIFRTMGFSILKFIATVVDYFQEAVDAVLDLNLYSYVSSSYKFSGTQTLVIAIAGLALIIGACAMVLFHEKIKASDFLINVLVSMMLLVAFPTFMSACKQLQSKGVDAVQEVFETDNSSVIVNEDGTVSYASLGSNILGNVIYPVRESVNDKEKTSYNDYYRNGSGVEDISINKILTHDGTWRSYYIEDISTNLPTQKKFDELTTENMMELLGLGDIYDFYERMLEQAASAFDNNKFIIYGHSVGNGYTYNVYSTLSTGETQSKFNVFTDDDLYVYEKDENGNEVKTERIWTVNYGFGVGTTVALANCYYGSTLAYPVGTSVGSFETYIKDQIANCDAVREAGVQSSYVGSNSRTIEEALDLIKDTVIYDLNVEENTEIAKEIEGETEYIAAALLTQSGYDNLSDSEKLWQNISVGYGEKDLYWWHMDFLEGLTLLLAICICLLAAGFKIVTTLFEIMFNQIITPFIIATDLNGAGRSKKAIQNMLLSTVVLMIVVMLIDLYISVVLGVMDSKYGDNIAVMLLVIVGGAKFVIDGPDLLTKIFGIDAGAKSGMGMIMGATQSASMISMNAVQTAGAAGKVASGAASTVAGAGKRMGGSIAGTAKGIFGGVAGGIKGGDTLPGKVKGAIEGGAVGGVTGAVGGAFGHTDAGKNIGGAVGEKGVVGASKDALNNKFGSSDSLQGNDSSAGAAASEGNSKSEGSSSSGEGKGFDGASSSGGASSE